MGWVGDAYDNAMCESFFATLECELLDRRYFPTMAGAGREVFSFIEGFHNTRRLHSALGYKSPANFEKLNHAALAPERPKLSGLLRPARFVRLARSPSPPWEGREKKHQTPSTPKTNRP